jgi:hypothetical protein
VPLNRDEYELLSFIEQSWLRSGAVPSKERCEQIGFNGALYKGCFKNREFLDACEERGIVINKTVGGTLVPVGGDVPANSVLTAEQLAVANAMLDLQDTRSQKKKLQDLEVSTAKYNAWLRDGAFQTYLRERAEALLGDGLPEAHMALLDRVRSGDVNAMKFYYEMTGRYVPQSAKGTNIDVMALMTSVVEVIQRHVHDPKVQVAISDDLLALARASAMAQGVTQVATAPTVNGVPIIQPTIATKESLTL